MTSAAVSACMTAAAVAPRLGPWGHAMQREQLKPNVVLRGPLFPEPVQVLVTVPLGEAVKVIAKGLRTSQVYEPVLSAEQLGRLEASPEKEPYDGDPHRFRL